MIDEQSSASEHDYASDHSAIGGGRTKKYQNFRFYWGERCQALACGGARYLPSLIALFLLVLLGSLTDRTGWRPF